MKAFLAKVIEIPEKLQTLILAGIMFCVTWLGALLLQWTGIDFSPVLAPIGLAIAALASFAIKALLERYVPEPLHGVVNAFLAWLALVLGGLFVQHVLAYISLLL